MKNTPYTYQSYASFTVEKPLLHTSGQREGVREGRLLYQKSYDTVLLTSVLLLSVLFFFLQQSFKRVKQSFGELFFSEAVFDKTKSYFGGTDLLQYAILSVSSFSLLFFVIKRNTLFTVFQSVFIAIIALFIFILCKYFLLRITTYTVAIVGLKEMYMNAILLVNRRLSVFVAPLVVLALLLPDKAYFYVVLCGALLFLGKIIAQTVLVFRTLIARKISLFHSFLYLCTLEILPVVYIVMLVGHLVQTN